MSESSAVGLAGFSNEAGRERMILDAVIDLSRHNAKVDLARVKAAGIVGVILKATEGIRYIDPTFAHRAEEAAAAGLLVGAYHFGRDLEGTAQADHFLRNALLLATLHILDFERAIDGTLMSAGAADAFLSAVSETTERRPMIYGGAELKAIPSGVASSFRAFPLWLSQYGPRAVLPAGWDHWALWQYTDKGTVDGVAGHVDRSRFAGTEMDLRALFTGKPTYREVV